MSLVLGIDTATDHLSVAVADGQEVIGERLVGPGEDGRPRHANALLPTVEELIGEAGGWERVSLIAAGVGPGTFTGLRIGIATANALAQARALPVAGVSSLAALAAGVREAHGERPVLAVIDARRREVFAALYDESGGEVWEPAVLAPTALAERVGELPAPPLAGGDGALRFRAELEAAGIAVLEAADHANHVHARHVCRLAAAARAGSPGDIRPVYLRKPDAELWQKRDSRK